MVPGTVPHELTLTRAVDQVLERGAAEVAVVPCEVEWKAGEWQDVPDTIQELARERPQARFRLAPPLAVADDLLDVVANRCAAAWAAPDVATAEVEAMVDLGAQPPIAVARLRPGEAPRLPGHKKHVFVCLGRVCQQEGSADLYDALTELIAERGLTPEPGMHGLLGRAGAAAPDGRAGPGPYGRPGRDQGVPQQVPGALRRRPAGLRLPGRRLLLGPSPRAAPPLRGRGARRGGHPARPHLSARRSLSPAGAPPERPPRPRRETRARGRSSNSIRRRIRPSYPAGRAGPGAAFRPTGHTANNSQVRVVAVCHDAGSGVKRPHSSSKTSFRCV